MSSPRPASTQMTREDAEEYTQALGQVVAGGWRQVALGRRLGVPNALGISTAEWVESRLGGYIRMSLPERELAVKELAGQSYSERAIAEVIGVPKSTVHRIKADADAPNGAEGPSASTDRSLSDAPNGADVKAEAANDTRTRRDVSRAATVLPDAMDYRTGDSRREMESVPDRSLTLVLTDPPYGDESVPLYEWLAEWAARKLIPGGSLICYTGQSRLNRDMRIFDQRLRYWWLLTMRHDRAQRLPGKFIIAESKPVLWYVNEYRRGRTLINDMISSERDQSAHPWAQGSGGVAFLIENLTEPGEMIADPFAGTARWGEIACQMGRRWVGCDVAIAGKAEVIA